MPTFTGTPQGDTLVGTAGDDILQGLDGADSLSGEDGADQLEGGLGNDTLSGLLGADVLLGGGNSDSLLGGDGDDSLLGEAGDDTLNGGNGADTLDGGDLADTLDGGEGADCLAGGSGSNILRGDAGDDTISGTSADTIFGGDGADTISFRNGMIDGGAGNDVISMSTAGSGSATITTGDGDDRVVISGFGQQTITDFDAAHDVVDITGLLSRLLGYSGSGNPFGDSFFRLVQVHGSTVLQMDLNGRSGGDNFNDLVTFQNFTGSLTAANFGGYTPTAPLLPPVGDPMRVLMPSGFTFTGQVSGTDPDGVVQGFAFTRPFQPIHQPQNFFFAQSGTFSYSGADSSSFTFYAVDGALFSDAVGVPLTVLPTTDTSIAGRVVEASAVNAGLAGASGAIRGADTGGATGYTVVTAPQYGAFTIDAAGAWTYQLNNSNVQVDQLFSGSTLKDFAIVRGSNNTWVEIGITIEGQDEFSGTAGEDHLIGTSISDTLSGLAGDDWLSGGASFDQLTGGSGADKFILTLDGSQDYITDFSVAERDHILLLDNATTITNGANGVLTLYTNGNMTWDRDSDAGVAAPVFVASMGAAAGLVFNKSSFAAGFQPSAFRKVDAATAAHDDYVFDWGTQTFDWTKASYDGSNRLLSYEVRFDDGAYSLRSNDVNNLAAWNTVVAEYDKAGQLFAYTVIGDDGKRTLWQYDTTNTRPWSRVLEEYDAQGRLTQQSAAMDDGSAWERHIDAADAQPWAYYIDNYANGALLNHTFYNANGTVFVG